jgi:hypothetical protein
MRPAETFSATGPFVRPEVAVHKLLPLLPAKPVSGVILLPLCCHRVLMTIIITSYRLAA